MSSKNGFQVVNVFLFWLQIWCAIIGRTAGLVTFLWHAAPCWLLTMRQNLTSMVKTQNFTNNHRNRLSSIFHFQVSWVFIWSQQLWKRTADLEDGGQPDSWQTHKIMQPTVYNRTWSFIQKSIWRHFPSHIIFVHKDEIFWFLELL